MAVSNAGPLLYGVDVELFGFASKRGVYRASFTIWSLIREMEPNKSASPQIAREIGKNHGLAQQLWESNIRENRTLAA